jgi:hypothetical protein
MTDLTECRQIYSGRAIDDLAVFLQIRWLIEQSGYEEAKAMLSWLDDRVDLPKVYAEAGAELGFPARAEAKA